MRVTEQPVKRADLGCTEAQAFLAGREGLLGGSCRQVEGSYPLRVGDRRSCQEAGRRSFQELLHHIVGPCTHTDGLMR